MKRNWRQYNKNLVQRGSITFFIDPNVLKIKPERNKMGRPRLFAQAIIQLLLILKIQYRLSYRALEGFSKSILPLLKVNIQLPTYSLTCKRAPSQIDKIEKLSTTRPKVVLIDASGIKVYGEGEWKVKIHGAAKRRKWIKLHIAIDAKSQEIVNLEVTHGHKADCSVGPALIERLPKSVHTVMGDGGYDTKRCRNAIKSMGATELIPPRRTAKQTKQLEKRNEAILELKGLGGDVLAREIWGKLTGYSRRSLVETAFSRLKRLYGDRFYSKKMETQRVEAMLKCKMMNQMLSKVA
jgi:hypothetical protein|tara:strand:+ start:90 stop:974 length:885 start_codon:yes stop_codon:yes gene_type:complete